MLTLPLAILCLVLSLVFQKRAAICIFMSLISVACIVLIVLFPCHRVHVISLEVAPIVWDRSAFSTGEGRANYVGLEVDRSYPNSVSKFNLKVYDEYGSPRMDALPGNRTSFVGVEAEPQKVRMHAFSMTTATRLLRLGCSRVNVVVVPDSILRTGENTLMQYGVPMYYQKDGRLPPPLMRWIGTTDADAVVAQPEAAPKPKG